MRQQIFAVDGFNEWWKRMQALPSFQATQPQ
jgi:glutathione S-transferase